MLRRTLLGSGAALALAACSLGEPMFAEPPDPETLLPPKIVVQRIETLELGRTAQGYVLTAFALAPGGGYYQPELAFRHGGSVGADGFYEFDFMIRPPDDASLYAGAPESARRVRADRELSIQQLRGAAGVRVWSATNSVEGRF